MSTTEEQREKARLKKERQRQSKKAAIAPETLAIIEGTRWHRSTRFLSALGSLPQSLQHGAALRVICRLNPATVEQAEALTKLPTFTPNDTRAAAHWIVSQTCLRAYMGRIAYHRVIPLKDAEIAARKVPIGELPDLLDAALAVVQSPHYKSVGGMREGVKRMSQVGKAQRRRVAREWREHGAATPAKHGPKVNIIRVSLDKTLQAYTDGEATEPLPALTANLDGSSTHSDNPYGIPEERERRKAGTDEDVYGLQQERG